MYYSIDNVHCESRKTNMKQEEQLYETSFSSCFKQLKRLLTLHVAN